MRKKKGRGDTRSLDSCTLHSSGFGLSVLVLQPIDVYNNNHSYIMYSVQSSWIEIGRIKSKRTG